MKKLTMIISFILMITTVFAFDINTTLFDQRIDNDDGYKEIVFKNKTDKNIRYKIKALKSGKDIKDMSSWVTISPTVLNIQPLSEKKIKIFAKAPEGSLKGEYSFMLKIEPIVTPTISKTREGKINGASVVAIVPIIKMFGYVGEADFEKNINLENINLKKVDKEYILMGTLVNKSYAGKSVGFNFIRSNNLVVEGKWIGRLSPNFKQDISLKVKGEFKEISIYDAETNKEIKRIIIPKNF